MGPMKNLVLLKATARSLEKIFPTIEQVLGEVHSIVIGPF